MRDGFSLLLSVLSLLVSILLFSGPARAGVIGSVGTSLAFEHEPDGRTYDIQAPLGIRVGYRFSLADTYIEYSHFDRSSEVSVLQISREHSEWLLWARHLYFDSWWVQPYTAAGLGIQYETVSTRFQTESANDRGVPQSVLALAGGFRLLAMERLSLDLEGRCGFSSTYSPDPLLGAGLYLGINF